MNIGPVADSVDFRRILGAFPTGVVAVATMVNERPAGIAASSFTSVSLEPPLVSVCIAHTSTTWPMLKYRQRFGISVLSAMQESACRQLSARGEDRFASLPWRATSAGAVLLDDAGAWLECSVYSEVEAGDHDIVVLRVHEAGADPAVSPLVFHGSRFRRLGDVPRAVQAG